MGLQLFKSFFVVEPLLVVSNQRTLTAGGMYGWSPVLQVWTKLHTNYHIFSIFVFSGQMVAISACVMFLLAAKLYLFNYLMSNLGTCFPEP